MSQELAPLATDGSGPLWAARLLIREIALYESFVGRPADPWFVAFLANHIEQLKAELGRMLEALQELQADNLMLAEAEATIAAALGARVN